VLYGRYEEALERESAYEKLRSRALAAQPPAAVGESSGRGRRGAPRGPGDATMDVIGSMAKSAARAAGTRIGREIIRGVLGSLFGGRRR
jgi:hypothetical protein